MTTEATTMEGRIIDAIESISASDCGNVERDESEGLGGWINVTIIPITGLTMRCGWWLYTDSRGLDANIAHEVRASGYSIAAYSGNECDHDVDAELLSRLAKEFDCGEEDVYYLLSDLWRDISDESVAEEVWTADLRETIEQKAEDAEISDLLEMLAPFGD